MPKLVCPCSCVHDLSPIPDAGWVTVRDRDYERLIADKSAPDSPVGDGASMHSRLYGCPKCGRLMWRREGARDYDVWVPATPTTVGDVDPVTARADRLHDLATQFVVGPENYRFLERLLATHSGTWQTLSALCAGVDVAAEFARPQGEVLVAWMPLRGDQPGTRTRAVLITLLHESAAWSEQVSYSGYVGPRHRAPTT